jgi:hypothetical protein
MTSKETLAKVERTCTDLLQRGEPVTFTTVAATAGISRTSLYRDQTLRTVVEEHRMRSHDPRTMTGLISEVGHLRTAVEALADRVRHHEEQLRHLDSVRRPNRKSS